MTVSNLGTAALQFSSVAYPSDFPEVAGVSNDCTSSTSLSAGGSCTLSINFLPTSALGTNASLALNESVGIATNTLNTAGTQQGVQVSGTEVLATGSVAIGVSSDPAATGAPITFTATVSGSTGGPIPTGTVSFYSGTTLLSGPLPLSNSVAIFSTSSLPVGSYAISASYSGDANYLGSNSTAITESIVAAPGTSSFGNTNIGSQNLGSTSSVIPLTITFSAAETLGSVAVLTEGAPNLDFANAGGGTCSIGTAYPANANCTVNVTFTPKYSGTRYGAVVLADNSGSVIGTGYLAGTGVGPQTVFLPGTLTSLATGFGYPQGVAIDGAGNLYIADAINAAVYKETLANGTYSQSTLGSGFSQPFAVAVDAAGNIYVADVGNRSVYKETPTNGGYVQTVIGYGFTWPSGVAVDVLGNVYVADYGNGITFGSVYLESLSNGSYTQSTIGSGFVSPQSVAVDGSGNIYVADSANGNGTAAVYELAPSNGSYNQTTIGSGWFTPTGVAVDANGNVFVTDDAYDLGYGFVMKEILQSDGSYVQSTLLGGTSTPYPSGVAVDGRGNIYVTDNFDGILYRDDLADPPALSFATTIFGSTSSDSPKTITVQNAGNATLNFSTLSYPVDFPELPGIPSDCTASTSLTPEAACTLSIDFKPASLGSTNQSTLLSENVTVTTNSLNADATAQAIAVSGTEAAPVAVVTLTVPANVSTVGTSVTFTAAVTGQNGVTAPTGSVTFSSNGSALSTVSLNNGSATYSTNSLAVGSYAITGTYSGDQVYPSATSSPIEEQITPASTFGTQNIGSTSSSSTFTFTFAKRVPLGSIAVVTQGVPNLDFTNTGNGTCKVGTTYTSGSSCTVSVAFKPLYSGARYGGIVLGDNKGAIIQAIYLEGTGVGPQVTFSGGSRLAIGSGQHYSCGMTVDSSGNAYVGGTGTNDCGPITKWTLNNGTYTQSTVPSSSLGTIIDLAVDGAGNLYIDDRQNNRVLKETLVSGTYSESTIGTGLIPFRVAVDGTGNVYILDGSFGVRILKETPSSSGYTQTIVPTSFLGALYNDLAVDGAGNVYVSDEYSYIQNGQVFYSDHLYKETLSGGTYTESTIQPTLVGFTVDGNGNIYGGGYELIPSGNGYTTVQIDTQTAGISAIAVDGGANVYVLAGNSDPVQLLKLDHADPPSVSFSSTNVGATSSDSPKPITLRNAGNATLTFAVPASGTNPSIASNFSLDSITTCPQVSASGSAASLNSGSSCTYGINFAPTVSGTINGSMVLTDNALNAVGGTQTIPLSGTGNTQPQIAVLAVGPGGATHVTWVATGTPLSSAVANSQKIWVDSGAPTFVVGIAEFQQGTCTEIGPGSLSNASDLLGGTISTGYGNFALPNNQCPGTLYQFSTASYTWGADQADLQDPFTLAWTEPNGQAGGTLPYVAEDAHITFANQCGSPGSNASLTATATLINPPSGAMGYTWTIIGGGGAVVFTNGTTTMSSPTPSITLKEPNPTGSDISFSLLVQVATPTGLHPYGPVKDTFTTPEVTFSSIERVPLAGTGGVTATLSCLVTQPITITLTTTTGTGSATIIKGGNIAPDGLSTTISSDTALTLKGITVSSTANNIKLDATLPDGSGSGTTSIARIPQTLAVVSVTLSLQTSKSPAVPNPVFPFPSLGVQLSTDFVPGTTAVAGAYQVTGTIMPSNYSGPIYLRRTVLGTGAYTDPGAVLVYSKTGDDTSNSQLESNPEGTIYDLDAPAFYINQSFPVGSSYRFRVNFDEYAVLGNSTSTNKVSTQDLLFFVRESEIKNSSTSVTLDTTYANDNQIGLGSTNPSDNLQ